MHQVKLTSTDRTCVCACVCYYVSALLFAFPEHQIHEAADERDGEADPGQDVGGSVGAVPQTEHMEGVLLSRVNGGSDHHTQRSQQLDNGRENESLSLFEPEELKNEDEEADTT